MSATQSSAVRTSATLALTFVAGVLLGGVACLLGPPALAGPVLAWRTKLVHPLVFPYWRSANETWACELPEGTEIYWAGPSVGNHYQKYYVVFSIATPSFAELPAASFGWLGPPNLVGDTAGAPPSPGSAAR